MEFKFDKRKRIVFTYEKLTEILLSWEKKLLWYNKFEQETGLRFTIKTKKSKSLHRRWHFKIVDEKKYLLAKIKYGI